MPFLPSDNEVHKAGLQLILSKNYYNIYIGLKFNYYKVAEK